MKELYFVVDGSGNKENRLHFSSIEMAANLKRYCSRYFAERGPFDIELIRLPHPSFPALNQKAIPHHLREDWKYVGSL